MNFIAFNGYKIAIAFIGFVLILLSESMFWKILGLIIWTLGIYWRPTKKIGREMVKKDWKREKKKIGIGRYFRFK